MKLEQMPQEKKNEELELILNDLKKCVLNLGIEANDSQLKNALDVMLRHHDNVESAAAELKEIFEFFQPGDKIDDTMKIFKESPEDKEE